MALLTPRADSPPYVLNEAQIGGLPTPSSDVPPATIFLVLFTASALFSIYLFWYRGIRQGDRFSALVWFITFLFSGERVIACILRIAWAHRLTNVRLAISAQVFVQIGVLLLYLMNIILAKRILFEARPEPEFCRRWSRVFAAMQMFTVAFLVVLVTTMVISVYTLDQKILDRCHDLERAGATWFLLTAVVPLLTVTFARCFPSDRTVRGTGLSKGEKRTVWIRFKIVVLSSLLCVLNAGFKAGVLLAPVRTLFDPAWYHSPACLYVLFFTVEMLVLLLFYIARIDVVFQSNQYSHRELNVGATQLESMDELDRSIPWASSSANTAST